MCSQFDSALMCLIVQERRFCGMKNLAFSIFILMIPFLVNNGILGVKGAVDWTKEIKIGGLLPSDPSRMFSRGRMQPAATIALEYIETTGILRSDYRLSISYRDSKCSESAGMNEAINFFIHGDVHAFFGPVCDYAAAPVARQIYFWNLPMVSVGTIAKDFAVRRKIVYPLLTRAGTANVHPLGDAFVDIMRAYRWSKVKILFQKPAYSHVLTHVCHFAAEAIVDNVRLAGFTRDYYNMGPNPNSKQILLDEIGNNYGGKCLTYNFISLTSVADPRGGGGFGDPDHPGFFCLSV